MAFVPLPVYVGRGGCAADASVNVQVVPCTRHGHAYLRAVLTEEAALYEGDTGRFPCSVRCTCGARGITSKWVVLCVFCCLHRLMVIGVIFVIN